MEDLADLHAADQLDQGAGEGAVQDYLNKIDTHLRVEKELLLAWQKKDELYKEKMEQLGKKHTQQLTEEVKEEHGKNSEQLER